MKDASYKVLVLAGFRAQECPAGISPEIVAVDPSHQAEFVSRIFTSYQRCSLNSTAGTLAKDRRPISYIHQGPIILIEKNESLTPHFFNRVVREAGGYVPVEKGTFKGRLPFKCHVQNIKTNQEIPPHDNHFTVTMSAAEVRCYRLCIN